MDSPMGSFKAFSFGENAPVYEDPLEEEDVISPIVPSGVGSRRQVVSAETYNAEEAADGFVPPVNPKNEQDVRYLTEVLSKHGLFKHLDDREVQVAVNAMFRRDYNKGDFLSKKGDQSSENDTFHVITSGSCSIIENEKKIKTLNSGDTYGELEMLYQQPRASTVYCEQHVSTWALDRKTYTHIMHNTFIKKRALYTEFLAKISFLQSMSHKELIQLADALQPDKFKKGEHLISYGEEGTWFYIIVEGVVEVWGRNEKGEKIPVCTFTRGDCVGELEFLHNHNTVADVVAQTDEVRVAKLNRQHFEMCMGPIKELLKQSRAVDPVFSYYRGTQGNETQQPQQPQLQQQLLQPQPQQLLQQPNQQIPQQLLHLQQLQQQQQQQQALFDKQFGNYKDITITPRVDFQITSNDLTPRYTSIAPAYNGSSRTGYSTSLVPYQAPTYTYDAPFGAPDFLFGAPTYTTPYHHPTMYSAHTYTHPLPDFGFYPHGPAPTYLAPQSYFPHPPPPSRLPPSLAYRPHVDDFLPYPHPSSYAYSGYNRRSHPFEYDAPLYSPTSHYGPINDFHHHVPSYALNTPRRFAAPPLYDDYNRFSTRAPIHHHLFSSQYTAPSPVWSRPFY